MKRVGYLYEKIYDIENLRAAHKEARKDKSFYSEVRWVDSNEEYALNKIRDMLKNNEYTVSPEDYKISERNDKGKMRTLHILDYYPHRIIQWAIILQIGDVLEKTFISTSYASIKGRGTLKASKDLRKAISDSEYNYFLKMDIRKFYPNIDREILKGILRKKFKDKKLLSLLDLLIDSSPDSKGIALGSLLSQWLGNFYLTYFDHYVKEVLRCKHYFRYCDDLIILGKNREELKRIKSLITKYLSDNLYLEVKPNWSCRHIRDGIDFVGYVHFRDKVLLRRGIKYSLRRSCHRLNNKTKRGKKLTNNDRSTIGSYYGWTKHCDGRGLYKTYIRHLNSKLEE